MSFSFKELGQALMNRQFPIPFPGHWIGGSWLAQERAPVIKSAFNPSRDVKITDIRLDKSLIGTAIEKAHEARGRMGVPLAERLEWIRRFRQALGDYQRESILATCIGVGKPEWEARSDMESSLRFLDQVLASGDELERAILAPARLGHYGVNRLAFQPVGVVAAFLPFSTPLASFVQYFAASMVAGCPLFVMSSSHAVLDALVFAHLCASLDLPNGAVNIAVGNFTFLQQALADNRVQAMIYRGSREHCDMIRKESRLLGRQLMLSSGGKNAVLIHESADLDLAVRCMMLGAFKSAGQLCASTSRAFVARSLMPAFKDKVREALRLMTIGPTDMEGQGPFMGPLYSKKAVEKFLRFQTMAKREAQETLQWGKDYEGETDGYFVLPGVHILERFDPSKAYQSNVLMCPDVAVYPYDDLEQAVAAINTTDAPLVVSFFGEESLLDQNRHAFVAPNLALNLPTVEWEASLPVTGKLQCGHHRYNGIGLAFLLTYPQSLAAGAEHARIINAWPWPKS